MIDELHNIPVNVRKNGNSLMVTIDRNIVKLLKLKHGDMVKISIKKIGEEDEAR